MPCANDCVKCSINQCHVTVDGYECIAPNEHPGQCFLDKIKEG